MYWVIGRWRCPACGALVLGSYDVDPGREKCSALIHRAVAVHVGVAG